MKTPIDKIKSLQGSPRSEWEREFLKNLRERIESDRGLTTAQLDKLNKLWKS